MASKFPRKNILIIGETGVGKSSVGNLILGKDEAPVGHGPGAGTFSHAIYPYGEEFMLIDTVGFNAAEPVNKECGIKSLVNLAGLVSALENGLSLIIFVMRQGRLTRTTQQNYDYFVGTFAQHNVPVLLVITHCDFEYPIDSWYLSKRRELKKEYKMDFMDSVSLSAVDIKSKSFDPEQLEIMRKKREGGAEKLRKAIGECVLCSPWRPGDMRTWLSSIFLGAAVFFGIGALMAAVFAASGPAGITAALATIVAALGKLGKS